MLPLTFAESTRYKSCAMNGPECGGKYGVRVSVVAGEKM